MTKKYPHECLCIHCGESCIVPDEVSTRLDVLPHQHREDSISLDGILESNLLEIASLRIHSRFPQLARIHLSKSLISLRQDLRLFSRPIPGDKVGSILVIEAVIDLVSTLGPTLIERRVGNINVSLLH